MDDQRPDDVIFRVLNEIGIVAQLSATMFERVMPAGMTLAQFVVLNHFVRLGGPRRPSELASAFQVSRGTMTSTLGRLASKKLVDIKDDAADGRGKVVSITQEGRAMREACIAALGPVIAILDDKLGRAPFTAALMPLAEIRRQLDLMR